MKRYLIIWLLLGSIIMITIINGEMTFDEFRIKHRKKYSSSEIKKRQAKYVENVKMINSLNLMATIERQPVKFGITKVILAICLQINE